MWTCFPQPLAARSQWVSRFRRDRQFLPPLHTRKTESVPRLAASSGKGREAFGEVLGQSALFRFLASGEFRPFSLLVTCGGSQAFGDVAWGKGSAPLSTVSLRHPQQRLVAGLQHLQPETPLPDLLPASRMARFSQPLPSARISSLRGSSRGALATPLRAVTPGPSWPRLRNPGSAFYAPSGSPAGSASPARGDKSHLPGPGAVSQLFFGGTLSY